MPTSATRMALPMCARGRPGCAACWPTAGCCRPPARRCRARYRPETTIRRWPRWPGSDAGPDGPSTRLHILASVWTVPLAWFVPFAAAERWLVPRPGPGPGVGPGDRAGHARARLHHADVPGPQAGSARPGRPPRPARRIRRRRLGAAAGRRRPGRSRPLARGIPPVFPRGTRLRRAGAPGQRRRALRRPVGGRGGPPSTERPGESGSSPRLCIMRAHSRWRAFAEFELAN